MGRRGRRAKQLLDDLKESRGFWTLKEEARDRTVWRTRFGRGYRIVVRLRDVDRALYKMLLGTPPQ
jgi:mRNA-degrading endonuclease RelE of RelBE toxin-antitoxin system